MRKGKKRRGCFGCGCTGPLLIIALIIAAIWIFGDDTPQQPTYTTIDLDNPFEASGIPTEGYNPNDTWSIYWYLCGSDLESKWGCASTDIQELMAVKLPDNVQVVIELGGAETWKSNLGSNKYNTRYLYDSTGMHKIGEISRANMGSAKTLEAFLKFCNNEYPADHKAIIMWNHGGGSVAGAIFDELYGFDSLSLDEIKAALSAVHSPSKQNPPYEMIGFDACLMATVDTANALSGFTRWMVASEDLEPGIGWDYTGAMQALANNPGMNGAQWGKEICDSFEKACIAEKQASTITLSVVNIMRIEELSKAYDDVGAEALLHACTDTRFFNDFGRIAKSAQSFGGNNFWDGYTNMVDLGDLIVKSGSLLPDYGSSLIGALKDCVVYKVNGPLRSSTSGLSCYYNFNSDSNDFRKFANLQGGRPFRWYFDYKISGDLNKEGRTYVQTLASQYSSYSNQVIAPEEIALPDADSLEDFPVKITDDGYAVLNLGPKIAERLSGVYCVIAFYDEAEDELVYLGRDNDLYGDWDKGEFTDNFQGYWGSIDGHVVYMELDTASDKYQVYTVPVLLNGEQYSLRVSYTYATEEYFILGALQGIDENGKADKFLRQLEVGDVLEPLFYTMSMDEGNDDILEYSYGRIVYSNQTRFEEDMLEDGRYVYIFEMVDTMNNSYYSEAVVIDIEDGEIYLYE
ncbi:MAG: clostripain-related cysteine peptidase [Eubacteriaceae bacterium]|nr:clostripain-related cysteine peptidase [Eubacteriaceae bacterium]